MAADEDLCQRIAVPTLLYSQGPLAQALTAIREAGFDQVDLWHVPGLCEHLPLDGSGRGTGGESGAAQGLAALLAERGLRPAALSLYTNPRGNLLAGLELAAALGAPRVILGPALDYHDAAGFTRLLKELVPRAAEAGLTVAVENHLNTGLDTVERLQELLAEVAHPAVRVCLAPPHLLAAGGSVEEALARLGGAIDYLYLWDMKPDYQAHRDGVDYGAPAHQLPGGKGRTDFSHLWRLLRDGQYRGGLGLMCTTGGSLLPGRVTEQLAAARRALAEAWAASGTGGD